MARRGAWQLRELIVTYCDWGGSSNGAREFVSGWLTQLQRDNPQLTVKAEVQRGSHPYITADYVNASRRHVDLRNATAELIQEQCAWLRGSGGRKTANRAKKRQISSQPTAQGLWKPTLDLEGRLKWLNGHARASTRLQQPPRMPSPAPEPASSSPVESA